MCAVGQAGEAGEPLGPARPFAGGDERGRQQCAERDPHGRSEQALLDRVAYEKDAAERERNAADPDRPLGAETLLEAHAGCRDRRRCGWRRNGRGCGDCRFGFARRGRLRRDGGGGGCRQRCGGRMCGRRDRLRCRCNRRLRPLRRSTPTFDRRDPRLDAPQLLAEPDGFHQRDDGDDWERQQQQHKHDKEQVHENHRPSMPRF